MINSSRENLTREAKHIKINEKQTKDTIIQNKKREKEKKRNKDLCFKQKMLLHKKQQYNDKNSCST